MCLLFASACADSSDDHAGVSSAEGSLAAPGAPGPTLLADDLAAVPPPQAGEADASAGTRGSSSAIGVVASGLTAAPEPKVIYLAYADGKSEQKTSPNPCPGPAPKFVCQFAPSLNSCQQQIQAYLDRWYADFNVVFTLERPTSGTYYTVVISSGGGSWCGAKENVGGLAPFLCSDLAGGVAYTFSGGRTAKETAVIIAQEQAHLVGLEHSMSTQDVMYPTICTDCDGFEHADSKVSGDVCGRTQQNSYQLMHDRIGAWTAGVKPTPFGCSADSSYPSVTILQPSDKATVDSTFVLSVRASDDCKIARADIQVTPMGLKATSTSAPFEWTLTRIKGQQKITVSVTDPSNKTSTTSITVNAPGTTATPAGTGGAGAAGGAGGAGASTGPSGTGGAAVNADGGAFDSSTAVSSSDRPATGCEVGGCELGGAGTPLSSSLSASLAVLCMSFVLRRRPAAKARSLARSR